MIIEIVLIGLFVLAGIVVWQSCGMVRDEKKIKADGEIRKEICTLELASRENMLRPQNELTKTFTDHLRQ